MNENLNKIIKRNVKRWFAIQQQNKKQLKLATVIKLLLFKLSKFLLAYVSKLELCGVKCLHLSASEACGFLFGFFPFTFSFLFQMNVGVAHSEVNPNTRVMNSRGIWLTYLLLTVVLHIVLLSIPFFTVPLVWTLTNVIHNLVSKA